MFKAIFFDAVGTLLHLRKSVGYHYALVGSRMGLQLDVAALDEAFAMVWKAMPARPATGVPRDDDDKGWWAELVNRVIDQVSPATRDFDRNAFFEAAYSHFAEPGVWELYPEAVDVLETLRPRAALGVISNFDGRLRLVIEQLGIPQYFDVVAISSEVGADKPDPLIFARAAQLAKVTPHKCLHVGDDAVRDWQGAATAGMAAFELDRPHNSLRDVLTACAAF